MYVSKHGDPKHCWFPSGCCVNLPRHLHELGHSEGRRWAQPLGPPKQTQGDQSKGSQKSGNTKPTEIFRHKNSKAKRAETKPGNKHRAPHEEERLARDGSPGQIRGTLKMDGGVPFVSFKPTAKGANTHTHTHSHTHTPNTQRSNQTNKHSQPRNNLGGPVPIGAAKQ